MLTRARKAASDIAGGLAAGLGRMVAGAPGLAGAGAVVTGVALIERGDHGLAWIVAGCFGLAIDWRRR